MQVAQRIFNLLRKNKVVDDFMQELQAKITSSDKPDTPVFIWISEKHDITWKMSTEFYKCLESCPTLVAIPHAPIGIYDPSDRKVGEEGNLEFIEGQKYMNSVKKPLLH